MMKVSLAAKQQKTGSYFLSLQDIACHLMLMKRDPNNNIPSQSHAFPGEIKKG
jgi:hypothetical protein